MVLLILLLPRLVLGKTHGLLVHQLVLKPQLFVSSFRTLWPYRVIYPQSRQLLLLLVLVSIVVILETGNDSN